MGRVEAPRFGHIADEHAVDVHDMGFDLFTLIRGPFSERSSRLLVFSRFDHLGLHTDFVHERADVHPLHDDADGADGGGGVG